MIWDTLAAPLQFGFIQRGLLAAMLVAVVCAVIGAFVVLQDLAFIGDETGPVRMRSSGRLYLGINDDVLTDNSGNFRVVVYY